MENGAIMAMGDDSDESTDDDLYCGGEEQAQPEAEQQEIAEMLHMVEKKHP